MTYSLAYGVDSHVELSLTDVTALAALSPAAPDVADVRRATIAALAEPLEFPLLSQAVITGDRVTVAVDRDVPQLAEVAAGIVEHLEECGVGREQVTILFAEARNVVERLPLRAPQTVPSGGTTAQPHLELHDPADRGRLCFFGSTKSGKPVYLHRAVAEADLLICVGTARGRVSWSNRGPLGGIYPAFGDAEARRRYRNPHLLDRRHDAFVKSQEEIESIGWQTGAQFAVQVVPGNGDGVAAIVAGELHAAARRAAELHRTRHRSRSRQRACVVAGLSGRSAQTWDQFAAALGNVVDSVVDGGAVALCTDLAESPGSAVELLSQVGDDREEALARIAKERPTDLFAAAQLADALCRVRVYLLSRLDPSLVEDLGMIPVGEAADVGRLAARAKSCLVVPDAQHAELDVPGDES